jgi:restriction system protein
MGLKASQSYLAQEVARGLNAVPVFRLADLGSQLEAVISERTEPACPSFELAVISQLDWLQFELLVQRLFEVDGLRVERTPLGSDIGFDMRLFGEASKPAGIVECKRIASTGYVSAETIRTFAYVVSREGAALGHLVTTGNVSRRAWQEVSATVRVTTGAEVVSKIKRLSPAAQENLKREVFIGKWWIPSCATCGEKKFVLLDGSNRCRDEPCTNIAPLLAQVAG